MRRLTRVGVVVLLAAGLVLVVLFLVAWYLTVTGPYGR
jgi:hypothetical protein